MSEFDTLRKTPNLNLNKPEYTNTADIEALNENSDILDAKYKEIGDNATAHNIAEDAHANVFSKYLPLAGGTMIGDALIKKNTDTQALELLGGTLWDTNPALGLYGQNHASYGGAFLLNARKGTNRCALFGKPDGTLTWGGTNVITGTVADSNTASNDASKKLGTTEFIKKANGWSFPNNSYFNLGQGQYTVPANGYVFISGTSNAVGNCYLAIQNVNGMGTIVSAYGSGYFRYTFLPVKKGDTVLTSSNAMTLGAFRFYYADGEV